MICKETFLLVCLFTSSCFLSQENWYRYKWSVENKNNINLVCDEAYNFDLKTYKNNTFVSEDCKAFSQESVLHLYEDLNKAKIYQSFEGKEEYIRKVLKTIVKDTTLTNHIKIFFYRDESLNASMSESAVLRLNIGMMARLNNEAELAMLLGHEVAHFMNQDVVKRYARSKENSAWTGDWQYGLKWKWYGFVFQMSYNPWYSREQEEAADLASIQFVKNSPYSLKSAGNLYRIFKRDEIRNEIKFGKQNRKQSTHPDPGERMKMVKDFLEDSLNRGKKNFVVDSLEFSKIKEICFMETVNVDLLSNDLDELITLTFSRYLLEPQNENNLAVLIEAIRRYMLLNEDSYVDKKSFILNSYQNGKREAATNYPFLSEKTPSVLNYLSKGFVDIWKEDLNSIKAKELMDQSVTEFVTNEEAYNYFKKKAAENKSKIAEHYKYFEPGADRSDLASYQKINTLFLSNDYLSKKSADTSQKKLIVILPFSTEALASNSKLEDIRPKTEKFNSDLVQYIRTQQSNKVLKLDEFSFYDQRMIRDLVNIWGGQFKEDPEFDPVYSSYPVSKLEKNLIEIFPEIYSLFKKNNASVLYFCVPIVYTGKTASSSKVIFLYYKIFLIAENKTIVVRSRKDRSIYDLRDESDFFKNTSKELASFIKRSPDK